MSSFTVDGKLVETELTHLSAMQIIALTPWYRQNDYHIMLVREGEPDLVLSPVDKQLFAIDGATFRTFPRATWGG